MDYFKSFITLIEEQPELFSPEDRQDLAQQVSTWSDDKDDIEDAIVDWTEARQPIRDALKVLSAREEERKDYLPENCLPEESRLLRAGNFAPVPKEKEYKPMLINTMHRSFSTSSQPVTDSKK